MQSKANVMVNKSVRQNFEFVSSFENTEESMNFKIDNRLICKITIKTPLNTIFDVACQIPITMLSKTTNGQNHGAFLILVLFWDKI